MRVGLIRRLLAFGRTFTGVLHRHRTGNNQHLLQTAKPGRFQQHAAHARVHRQARQLTPQRRELILAVDCRQLLQQVEAVSDGLAIRRFNKRERSNLAQTQVQHLQDYGGKVGPQNFRISKFRAPVEVFFGVQTHTDTRLNPTATAFTLIGTGLGNRFDGQALNLGPIAIAADTGGAAVDHIANARHRQRGFSHVGCQHHATPRVRLENALLLGR